MLAYIFSTHPHILADNFDQYLHIGPAVSLDLTFIITIKQIKITCTQIKQQFVQTVEYLFLVIYSTLAKHNHQIQ